MPNGASIDLSKVEKSLARATTDRPKPSKYPIIFYSFDLVDSTHYKTIEPEWISVFKTFFENIDRCASKHVAIGLRVWKFVGDEVILKQRVRNYEDILKAPKIAWDVMNQALEYLSLKTMILSLKTTIWIALVEDSLNTGQDNDIPNHSRNIRLFLQTDSNNKGEEDFLGTEIDIGFRISKHSSRAKVVLSADLSYLINRIVETKNISKNLRNNCKIVDYVKLKGVWGGRYYPIVWYDTRWSDPSKMFSYDEWKSNDIARKIIEFRKGADSLHDIHELDKVYRDLGFDKDLNDLYDLIDHNLVSANYERRAMIPVGKEAELHCSVLCFTSEKKVILLKRSPHRLRLKNLWEFGCVQLGVDQDIESAIVMGYKAEYGINIENKSRIFPFITYCFMAEDSRTIPGVRFIAWTRTPIHHIKKQIDQNKYSDVKLISEVEVDALNAKECVSGLKEALKRAFGLNEYYSSV